MNDTLEVDEEVEDPTSCKSVKSTKSIKSAKSATTVAQSITSATNFLLQVAKSRSFSADEKISEEMSNPKYEKHGYIMVEFLSELFVSTVN